MTAPVATDTPLADPAAEAGRVLDAATAAGLPLRATGGVAVALCAPRAATPPLRRSYQDVDFVARASASREVEALFAGLGYVAEEQFNALHGHDRLFFHDAANDREADVFLDAVRGCHTLDVRERLEVVPRTLAPADLLLTKLQVRETNPKDYLDILALVLEHPLGDDPAGIEAGRLAAVCGADWGWWRTVGEVARRARALAPEVLTDRADADRAAAALGAIVDLLDGAPKSRRWKLRARVGDRMPWFESPEELDH